MLDVQVRRPVASADVARLRSLADAATRVDHHPSLGDAVWRDLRDPGPDSTVVLARSGDEVVGALHATRSDPATVTASLVVHPRHRAAGVAAALLDALVADVRDHAAEQIRLWIFGAGAGYDALVADAGFRPERELWQMRVRLPLEHTIAWPAGIEVRCFEPGHDEDAWVPVNNRAFRDDPDQGGWTVATLLARESEPWFDPQGFLLAFDGAGLAGFCWTKVHPPDPPGEPDSLGEIYVVGVDPDRQGTGLGRALVAAGLAPLGQRGVEVGMLSVNAANTAAVRLYRALGFEVARIDRAYVRTV